MNAASAPTARIQATRGGSGLGHAALSSLITQAAFGKSAALAALRDSGALAALCAARKRAGGERRRGCSLAARRQLIALRLTIWRRTVRWIPKKWRWPAAMDKATRAQKSMKGMGCGWWRWADDLAAHRSPMDFSAAAREARRIELAARLLNGSLIECALGACPPLPAQKYLNAARLAGGRLAFANLPQISVRR